MQNSLEAHCIFEDLRAKRTARCRLLRRGSGPLAFHPALVEAHGRIVAERNNGFNPDTKGT
jgi:hypothetical protein